MTNDPADSLNSDEGLGAVLAACIEAIDRGDTDPQTFLARYPSYAAELREFFAGEERAQRLAAPLRPVIQATQAPSAFGMADVPPDRLGDFRILREVGRGGMGIVYEAEQVSLGRKVALKVLPFAATLDARQLQRFHNEARAAAGLHHTNIVPVYFVGCERGVHFYAMQFIDGWPLSELIRQFTQGPAAGEKRNSVYEAPLSETAAASPTVRMAVDATLLTGEGKRGRDFIRTVAQLGIQAAEALEHAHQLGIVHRDIKPANLLVDNRGTLWVTDFGLAHCQSQAGLTMSGDLVGTLRYMSPEQALGQRTIIDHRTDLYSLGVTLYELLTLEHPFAGNDRQELLRQIAFEEPRPPRRRNRAIPPELETIVLKAMEKSPADRYATAQEMADDLRRYLEDKPIRARRPSILARLQKWSWRHRGAISAVVTATLLVLAATSGVIVWQWRLAVNAGAEARKQADIAKAINRFLIKDMLSAAKPEEALGRKITVEEVLNNAALKIDSAFPNETEEAAAVRLALGSAYRALSLYQEAELHVQRALAIRQNLLGADALETLEATRELGRVWQGQNKSAEAEQLFRQTLERARRVLGEEHRLTLQLQMSVADTIHDQSSERFVEAELLYRQCLQAETQILGEEDEDTLETMDSLAWLLHEWLSKWQEAERLCRRCLEIRRRLLTAKHPATLETQNDLAQILLVNGEWKEGERLSREAFQLARSVLGPRHNLTLEIEHELAMHLSGLDRLEEAETHLREVVKLRPTSANPNTRIILSRVLVERGKLDDAERVLGEVLGKSGDESVWHNPFARCWLGLVLQERGKWAEAEEHVRYALAAYRRASGAGHHLTPRGASFLAILLDATGQYDEAGALFREALEIWHKNSLQNHPFRAITLCAFGEHLLAVGDLRQAEEALTEALRIERATLPPEHRIYGQTLCALGWLRTQTGQASEGERLLREGLPRCQRAFPKKHWLSADAASRLGSCLTALRHFTEAEKLLLDSYETLHKAPGTPPVRTIEAVDRIVKLYETWGKANEAAQWRAKRLALPKPPEKGPKVGRKDK
jgi:serine/threonine protein kinase